MAIITNWEAVTCPTRITQLKASALDTLSNSPIANFAQRAHRCASFYERRFGAPQMVEFETPEERMARVGAQFDWSALYATQDADCPPSSGGGTVAPRRSRPQVRKRGNRAAIAELIREVLEGEAKSRAQILEEDQIAGRTTAIPPLTQKALAKRVGTSESTVSRIFGEKEGRPLAVLHGIIHDPNAIHRWKDYKRGCAL